ncbi:hypothetical protein BDF22DRAFT_669316 [Syncephalis plumigaleata]|nr:hypothetical protein BDF22DRAFT_669316 [Syncephalis plumigaleata]
MKLIAVLLALNALAAVQLVAADCAPEVVEKCVSDLQARIVKCADDLGCKCPDYKSKVGCYNGCENEADLGQQKIAESEHLAYCKAYEDGLKSKSSASPSATAKPTGSVSSPSATSSSTVKSDSKSNAAASNIDGGLFTNTLLAGAAAVAGVVVYYA